MSSHLLVLVFQAMALLGAILTAYKLLKTGLHRRYWAFFLYFVFRILNGSLGLMLDIKSNAYFYCWVLSTPISWMFYILVVREIYGLVLERHKGMYTLGRWLMYFGVALSVILSVLTYLPHFPAPLAQRSQLHLKNSIVTYILVVNRGATFGLAVFLVLMVFLLSLYAVTLSRNVKIHTTLFACFFLTSSIVALLRGMFGLQLYNAVDTGLMGISSICTFAWFFLLTAKGEAARRDLPSFGPHDENRILYQLDALNSTLMKVASGNRVLTLVN